jgi:Tol biopolymer transport system component
MGNKMGDQPARLTDNSDYDGDPAWSPDGKSVAFVRGRYGMGTQLHLLDLGSLKDRPIAAPGIRDVAYPMWSPDGRRLLAVGRGDGKAAGVAECDLAAETVRWLPGVPPKISSISPDGKWLAFTVQHKINILVRLLAIGNEDHTHRVHVLDLGTGKLKLVGPKTGLYDWDTRPAWSPDGQRLAWIRNYRKTRCRVLVHDARRKCVRKIVLPREEGRGWGPRVWSPDGLRLACVTRNQSAHRFGLHIVNLGTGQVSRVLTSELEIWLCAWEQP